MLLRVAPVALLTLALAACGSSGGSGASSTSTQASNLPPGCSPTQTHAIIDAFLTHGTVAPAGWFKAYSETQPTGKKFHTTSGPAAGAHRRARVHAGEQDRIIQLLVSPVDENHVSFSLTMTRFSPDFVKHHIYSRIARATGTVDCAHGKLAGMTLKGP